MASVPLQLEFNVREAPSRRGLVDYLILSLSSLSSALNTSSLPQEKQNLKALLYPSNGALPFANDSPFAGETIANLQDKMPCECSAKYQQAPYIFNYHQPQA